MTSDLHSARPHLPMPALLLACSGTTLDQNNPGNQPPSPPRLSTITTCLDGWLHAIIIIITIITNTTQPVTHPSPVSLLSLSLCP